MNKKVTRICEICQKNFQCWHTYKTRTCSKACRKELVERNTIERFSQKVGEPFEQWVRQKYELELWSYRDIIYALQIQNVGALINIMRRFGIKVRRGSDAVATQWIDNPKRRELSRSLMFNNDLPPKADGFNWAQQPGIGEKISQAKKGHEMYSRQSWYENVCKSIQARIQAKENTDIEQIMQIALEETGLPFERQKRISTYTVDFSIEINDYKLAVECDGLYWHTAPGRQERDAKRDKDISDLGWTIIRFSDKDIHSDISRCIRIILVSLGY